MRGRLIFIIACIVLIGGFAAQNWPEFTRTSTLTLGIAQMSLPLGLILLSALAVVLGVFLVSSATQESRHLLEQRRHTRDLQAQRELAEKAEASRFTDLRTQLDSHLRDARQRDTIAATEYEKAVMQSHRELRAVVDQMGRQINARLNEIESRFGGRVLNEPAPPLDLPPRDRIKL